MLRGRSTGLPHGPATPGRSWSRLYGCGLCGVGSLPSVTREARTTALVIASDAGSGFDAPKYAVKHRGNRILEQVLGDVESWPVDETFVVLGSDAEEVLEAVRFGNVTVVIDPQWSEGTAASLRVGLDALSRDASVENAVLARGDQPGVTAAIVGLLLDACEAEHAVAAVPKYRYARGWPIVVTDDLFPRLMGLEGDADVLDVLASHPDGVTECWFDQLSPHRLETPDDLRDLHRG